MHLLTDAELMSLAEGIEHDPALSRGAAVELFRHPVYGRDLRFYFALTCRQDRVACLGASDADLLLNRWYRFERFRLVYDELERYCDGNAQLSGELLADLASAAPEGDLIAVVERVDHEVQGILGGRSTASDTAGA